MQSRQIATNMVCSDQTTSGKLLSVKTINKIKCQIGLFSSLYVIEGLLQQYREQRSLYNSLEFEQFVKQTQHRICLLFFTSFIFSQCTADYSLFWLCGINAFVAVHLCILPFHLPTLFCLVNKSKAYILHVMKFQIDFLCILEFVWILFNWEHAITSNKHTYTNLLTRNHALRERTNICALNTDRDGFSKWANPQSNILYII